MPRDGNSVPVVLVWDYSGRKSVSTLIHTGPGIFGGVVVETDGTNDVEWAIYDALDPEDFTEANHAAGFTVKGSDGYGGQVLPTKVQTGIYLYINGTGGKASLGFVA